MTFSFLSTLCPKTAPTAKTSITHNFKVQIPVRWLYYRSGYQGFLKNFEGFLTIFIKYKRNILLEKISEGSRGLRKVLDKSSIETSMTEKTTHAFDVPWIGHPFNSFNIRLVHFNSPLGNLVTKNYSFVNHEVHFSQLSTKFVSSHLCKTLLRLWRQWSKEVP